MAVRIASRSDSLAAQSHISSSDFGGLRTSKRPMARAGASAQPPPRPCPAPPRSRGLAEVLQEPFRVRVQKDRRLARLADAGGLDLRLVDGAGPEVEVLEDLVRHRELDGAGQLEAIAADELRGGRHPADEVVLLQAQDPHPAAGHDRRGAVRPL
jgi:hypothetical protein